MQNLDSIRLISKFSASYPQNPIPVGIYVSGIPGMI